MLNIFILALPFILLFAMLFMESVYSLDIYEEKRSIERLRNKGTGSRISFFWWDILYSSIKETKE